jgi:hypothetical protein
MRIGWRCLSACALVAVWFGAAAQPNIYRGSAVAASGLTLSPWGSGSISEATDMVKEGTNSIKVVTRGFYQGGIVSFKTPVDLKPSAADPNSLLTFQIAIPEGSASGATSDTSISVKQLRLVFTFDDGKLTEVYVPVYRFYHSQGQWHAYAISIAKMPKFGDSSGKLSAIGFYADIPTTLYVGEIFVAADRTPIGGEIYSQYTNVARDDEIPFTVTSEGGDTDLRYYWDWDASDGIQPDSEGPFVWHRFRVPGEVTVTLTIADAYGVKQPFTTTMKITVNP